MTLRVLLLHALTAFRLPLGAVKNRGPRSVVSRFLSLFSFLPEQGEYTRVGHRLKHTFNKLLPTVALLCIQLIDVSIVQIGG